MYCNTIIITQTHGIRKSIEWFICSFLGTFLTEPSHLIKTIEPEIEPLVFQHVRRHCPKYRKVNGYLLVFKVLIVFIFTSTITKNDYLGSHLVLTYWFLQIPVKLMVWYIPWVWKNCWLHYFYQIKNWSEIDKVCTRWDWVISKNDSKF